MFSVAPDCKLNFAFHMDNISAKVCFTLRQLYNSNLHLPLQVKHAIVHSVFMTYVNYGIEDFSDGLYKLDKHQPVVKRITRFAYNVQTKNHIYYSVHAVLKFFFTVF